MSTELMTTEDKTIAALEEVYNLARQCSPSAMAKLGRAARAVVRARGMYRIMQAFARDKELNAILDAYEGSQIGFGVDKKYDAKVKQVCAIQALIQGAELTNMEGPEWMILAGKCYLCKPYYARMLRELEGVSDVVIRTGKPEQTSTDTAWVPVTLQCRVDGKLRTWQFVQTDELDLRIGVRVNQGMLIDAILGKAEAKSLSKVFRELSGTAITEPDEAPADIVPPIEKGQQSLPIAQSPVWQVELDGCKTLKQIQEVVTRHQDSLEGDQVFELDSAANEARERIREKRGERTN